MRAWLPSAVLFSAAFTVVTQVEPWFQTWAGFTSRQGNVLQALLGDSRRMFANHFFVKADAYFHKGYYPTVFDNRESFQTAHVAADAGALEEKNTGDGCAFLEPPRDWIDAFGRRFYPSEHTHMGEGAGGEEHDHDHEQEHEPSTDEVREILPWLRMSVELDPHRVESYVVAAYWLRERMDRVEEAEQFLREGYRENPESYELLFEMGRIAFESRHDHPRARMLWQLATDKWHKSEARKTEPDRFMLRQIMSSRAHLEEAEGKWDQALEFLNVAKAAASVPDMYDIRIKSITEKAAASARPAP